MRAFVLTGILLLSAFSQAAEPQQPSGAQNQETTGKANPATPPTSDQSGTSSEGMQGMQGMQGMMGNGMSCGGMMAGAKVTVENTKDGAVVRLTTKDKASVARVQQMAQMMKSCMSGGGGTEGQKR